MTTIYLDAPGKNAISTDLMLRIQEQVANAGDEPLFLTGANGVFSAGMNLKEVAEKNEPEMVDFLHLLEGTCRAIFHHPGPTVAWVNGHAIAGGCILALCCDRIVSDNNPKIRIGLNEVALGLRFPPRIFDMMRYRIPQQALSEVVLAAGLHSPEKALQLGLVDHVSDTAEADARALLKRFSALPRHAYSASKADLQAGVMDISPEIEAAFLAETVPRWVAPELKAMIKAMFGSK